MRPTENVSKPEVTIEQCCAYDKAHRVDVYTQAWIDLLIEKMNDESEYDYLQPAVAYQVETTPRSSKAFEDKGPR